MEESFAELGPEPLEKENLSPPKSSSLKSTITNLAYNIKNNCIFQLPFSSRVPLTFSSGQDKVHLLGKNYDKESRDQFYNAFEKILWFSYRKLSQCEDVGWGCMIRVIQMLVAQAITRDQPQLHPDSIIDLFRQQKNGPVALSRICKMGQINARWTSCPEILSVVSSILSEMKKEQKIGFQFQIYCDQLQINSPTAYSENDFPKLITVHTKIGERKTIPEESLFHLLQLAKDRRFVGMASGQRNEALYVVGTFGKKAIILDPHYVQENQSFCTFFCRNPQGIDFTELASGVSLTFYLPSLEEFEDWVGELIYGYKLSFPHSCFGLQVKDQENWTSGRRKGSDDFQLL